nr:transmembrane emp24 domain-containing protein p24beta2-like [Tanacetum cinerariifolium]
EDVKDWTIDVLTDALTRAEECVKQGSKEVMGIRFVIDREECLSHNVEYEGDTVHVSFVVIKAETVWHFTEDGVDLVDGSQGSRDTHGFL